MNWVLRAALAGIVIGLIGGLALGLAVSWLAEMVPR